MDENSSAANKSDYLWRHQYKNKKQDTNSYIDTTTCFEILFRSHSNVSNNENIMMTTQVKQLDTNSFFVPKQNTSEENFVGSKYLLVPPGGGAPPVVNAHMPTGNAHHGLHHQYSLPNHGIGYHRGSIAERSSSIITEHSGTSETPPITGGKA